LTAVFAVIKFHAPFKGAVKKLPQKDSKKWMPSLVLIWYYYKNKEAEKTGRRI
jgi:hypothetical protein